MGESDMRVRRAQQALSQYWYDQHWRVNATPLQRAQNRINKAFSKYWLSKGMSIRASHWGLTFDEWRESPS